MKQLWKFTEAEVKVTKQFALDNFISIYWYISVKISRLLKWIFWEWFNVFVQDLKETYKRALTLKIHCGQTKIYFNFSFCTFNLHHLLHIHPNFQVSTANTFRVNQFSFGRHQLSTRSFLISSSTSLTHFNIHQIHDLDCLEKRVRRLHMEPARCCHDGRVNGRMCRFELIRRCGKWWPESAAFRIHSDAPFTWNCNCIFNLSRLK